MKPIQGFGTIWIPRNEGATSRLTTRTNIRERRGSIDGSLGGFALELVVVRRGHASCARGSRRDLVGQGGGRDFARAGSSSRVRPHRLPAIDAPLPAGAHGRP